jgi:hypothetical protein
MGQGPAAAGKDARRAIFDWPAPGPVGRRHPLIQLVVLWWLPRPGHRPGAAVVGVAIGAGVGALQGLTITLRSIT